MRTQPVRTITIEIYERDGIDIIEGEKVWSCLTWDEALGSIAEMTHPSVGTPRYRPSDRAEQDRLRTEEAA